MSSNNGTPKLEGVLCSFSYGCISGTKRDPTITREVLDNKNAGEDAGSWSNRLFPAKVCGKKNAFTDLRGHLAQMRSWHYSNTYLYEDLLWRILPEKRIEAYKQVVEIDGKARASELLEAFIEGLPTLIDMARLGRGEAFKESDYPTADQAREKFYYTVSYRPIPTGDGLNPAFFQEAISEINARNEQKMKEANAALIERFMAPFKILKEQLENPEGRKLKPVMESIVEITGMVESLDLSGNTELVASAKQMHDLFAQLQPEMVKKDEEVRKMLGTTCGNVLSSLERFGNIGARKFN